MANFTIVGLQYCKDFAYVCYVADLLQNCLPDFHYRKIAFGYTDWKKWILEENEKNNWNHSTSPLIYQELTRPGGKIFYVGGKDEFWEYINDYYGLEYVLSRSQIQALREANIQHYNYKKNQNEDKLQNKDFRKICICDAEKNALTLLIPEIIKNKELFGKDGLVIYIYNEGDYKDYFEFGDEPDLYNMKCDVYHVYVQAIKILEDYIKSLDILILFGTSVYEPTVFLDFLDISADIMCDYADIINSYAKQDLRIIVACPPTCFNATILTELVKTVNLHNIIAITADVGLQVLSAVSKKVNIPVRYLSSPPVYGFINVNQLVDIGNIIQRYKYVRPSSRILKKSNNSTLTTGKAIYELRTLKYLTHNLKIGEVIENQKKNYEKFNKRSSCYGKVHATVDLLKQWYSKESEDVLSAGILTSGLYGISQPLVFSQPVMLQKDIWRPCTLIPISKDDIDIKELVQFPTYIKEFYVKLLKLGS